MHGGDVFEPTTHVLDATNGRTRVELAGNHECVYDDRSVLVCASADAFHGRVYVDAQHGPAILDARSGRDVVPETGLCPDVVVPGFVLVKEDNTLYAYAAG
jgi:hypothetical protein